MTWLPRWKRKNIRANKLLEKNEVKMNQGWSKWFAWRPVVTNRKNPPFYYESERVVWLEMVERRWYRQDKYESFRWIYHKKETK